jgi:hypothetical protein
MARANDTFAALGRAHSKRGGLGLKWTYFVASLILSPAFSAASPTAWAPSLALSAVFSAALSIFSPAFSMGPFSQPVNESRVVVIRAARTNFFLFYMNVINRLRPEQFARMGQIATYNRNLF